MKNLILSISVLALLQSCSDGSSSGAKETTQPVVLSPAQDITALPSSVILRSDLCMSNSPTSIDGAFYKVSFVRGLNQEFDTLIEYFSSSCDINDKTMTQAFLNDVLSSQKIGEDYVLTLSLVDVQMNILNVDTLNSYNQAPLYETTWTINNLVSVINKKTYPTDIGPGYISNSQTLTNVRVHIPEKIVYINNVKFTYE
jgi:hypothetical protein